MHSTLPAVPSCIYRFWHGVIPTSYFIFNDFYYTCFTQSCRYMLLSHTYYSGVSTLYYACTYIIRAEIEVAHRYRMRTRTHIIAEVYTRVRTRSIVGAIGNSNDNMAAYYKELAAKTWISPPKGTKLLLYRKDHVRSKLRPFHVKIIDCRFLNLAVGRLKKKKKKQKMEKIAVCPISVYNVSGVL